MDVFLLNVNGTAHQVRASGGESLLSILRNQLQLTGTKYGCGEGQCGACTVLMDGIARRSCRTEVGSAAGVRLTTIEGLESNGTLSPVQQAFLDEGAFQCGYCTPGMILSATALLREHPRPSDEQVIKFMNGNLCRCGTYPRIRAAITRASQVMEKGDASDGGR